MKFFALTVLFVALATAAHVNGWQQPTFQKCSLSSSPLIFTCDDSELKTEISALRDEIASLQQPTCNGQTPDLQTLLTEIQQLQQACNVTALLTEISQLRQEIRALSTESQTPGSFSNPALNCGELFTAGITTTGTYWLNTGSEIVNVTCDFDLELPPPSPGRGWQKIANIDLLSDPTQSCPSPWKDETSPTRRCTRITNNGGCESVFFSTNGVPFSKLCGRAVGYALGSPAAFAAGSDISIDKAYVDGLSITYTADGTRQHIWSLAASNGFGGPESSLCRCGGASHFIAVPAFIEGNYYCERDNLQDAPLWDGIGCDHEAAALDGPCCENPNLPWFCREFDPPIVTDSIEVRLCTFFDRSDADVEFDLLKLYIQ